MKKLIPLLILVLILSACNNSEKPSDSKKQESSKNFEEIDLALESDNLTMKGILTIPNDVENYPVVVLVHGSGGNDLDESYGKTQLFKDLASELANQGIATYRYNKRSFEYANELMSDLEFTVQDEVITDAVNAVELVSKQDGVDTSKIFIAGHSYGGYLIPMINEATTKPAGYILLAGSARPIEDIIVEQITYLVGLDGEITDAEQTAIDTYAADVKRLETLEDWNDDEYAIGTYKQHWLSLADYDAMESAKKIEQPVLVLQGGRDYNVTEVDYEMWKEVGNENWTYEFYPELMHSFSVGSNPPSNTDYMSGEPFDTTVSDDIASWIKAQ